MTVASCSFAHNQSAILYFKGLNTFFKERHHMGGRSFLEKPDRLLKMLIFTVHLQGEHINNVTCSFRLVLDMSAFNQLSILGCKNYRNL